MSATVGDPSTKQRSTWEEWTPPADPHLMSLKDMGSEELAYYRRNVSDGTLRAIVAREAGAWHLSISFVDHRGEPRRYPKWDEISHARYELVPLDVTMAMLLPPPEEFVAIHATTFHLHEISAEVVQ